MSATPVKISLCVVTNRFDLFFNRAIHSIESQTVAPYEVILVIDGMSSKMSGHHWFKGLPDSWTKVWTETENSGPSNPKNIAMHYASGDYVLLLDGDDIIVPSTIEFYTKALANTKPDVVAEYVGPSLKHAGNLQITKNLPSTKNAWFDSCKTQNRSLMSGSWKKGLLPIRPLLIKKEGLKFFPLDYSVLEDKVLLLSYMLEERRILVSDFPSYIQNIHPNTHMVSVTRWGQIITPDEVRFKRMAANININGWVYKEKIFSRMDIGEYYTSADIDYIEKTISYLSFT